MKLLGFLMAAFLLSGVTWMGDFKAATTEAAKADKLILVNFSGSDWCGPCIQLLYCSTQMEKCCGYGTASPI